MWFQGRACAQQFNTLAHRHFVKIINIPLKMSFSLDMPFFYRINVYISLTYFILFEIFKKKQKHQFFNYTITIHTITIYGKITNNYDDTSLK